MSNQQPVKRTADQALADQILADRFEVLAEPLGWRCLGCGATVSTEQPTESEVARLAEAAADHGLYCGRCDD